jgi:hypothetical protein
MGPAAEAAIDALLDRRRRADPQGRAADPHPPRPRRGRGGVARRHGAIDVLVHPAGVQRLPRGVAGRAAAPGRPSWRPERVVQAIETPGHASDHLAFWLDEDRAVVVGDLVAGRGSTWVGLPDGDVVAYLASLERVAALARAWSRRATDRCATTAAPCSTRRARIAWRGSARCGPRSGRARPRSIALRAAVYPGSRTAVHDLAERSLLAHLHKLMRETRVMHLGPTCADRSRARRAAEPRVPAARRRPRTDEPRSAERLVGRRPRPRARGRAQAPVAWAANGRTRPGRAMAAASSGSVTVTPGRARSTTSGNFAGWAVARTSHAVASRLPGRARPLRGGAVPGGRLEAHGRVRADHDAVSGGSSAMRASVAASSTDTALRGTGGLAPQPVETLVVGGRPDVHGVRQGRDRGRELERRAPAREPVHQVGVGVVGRHEARGRGAHRGRQQAGREVAQVAGRHHDHARAGSTPAAASWARPQTWKAACGSHRPRLMLFALASGRWASAGSRKASLTSRWQSSKLPSTANACTPSRAAVSWARWTGLTPSRGKSTTTSRPSTPAMPAATAPPVSPEVATSTRARRRWRARARAHQRPRVRAATSLKARVGPWNSSSRKVASSSRRSGTGKSSAARRRPAIGPLVGGEPGRQGGLGRVGQRGRRAPAGPIGGIRSGTYRPPSGARPPSSASSKPTRGPPARGC